MPGIQAYVLVHTHIALGVTTRLSLVWTGHVLDAMSILQTGSDVNTSVPIF